MRQQGEVPGRQVLVDQRALIQPIVAGQVMLEAEVRDVVAERQQEVIDRVVARPEQPAGFDDESIKLRLRLGIEFDRSRTFGGDMKIVLRARFAGRQFHRAEVKAGVERRIDEGLERNGRELDARTRARNDWQRRSVLPAVGQLQGGSHRDLRRRQSLRIENQLVPAQDRQVRSRRGARSETVDRGRRAQEVERDVHGRDARGNVDVEFEHVGRVAAPAERLAPRLDPEARDVRHRPRRAVLAGNPLRVLQRERACADRDLHPGVDDASVHFGGIDGEVDGSGPVRGRQACLGVCAPGRRKQCARGNAGAGTHSRFPHD